MYVTAKKLFWSAFAVAVFVPVLALAAGAPSSVYRDSSGFIRPLILADYIKASYFTATSTTIKSTFPYASTTALSATTLCLIGDTCRTTWPTGGGGDPNSKWATSTGSVITPNGAGGILVNASSTFTALLNLTNASSSLFTATTAWLPSLATAAGAFLAVDNLGKIIATTTPTSGTASTTLLSDNNTFSGSNTFARASTTLATFTTSWFPSITNAILSTNNLGLVAATTSIGTNYLTGVLGTINSTSFSRGDSITIAAASSTLLGNNNTFSGNIVFSNIITGSITGNAGTATALAANGANCTVGNYPLGVNASGAVEDCTALPAASASTTLLSDSNWWTGVNRFTNASTSQLTASSTVYFTGLSASSLIALDSNNRLVATSSIGTNLLTGTLATINSTTITAGGTATISAATSTLLLDSSWFTGTNRFVNASTSMLTATSTVWLTSLGTPAGAILAVDPTGRIIATTTSTGGVTAVTGTYPIISSGGATPAISSAFGTTTANTWGALNLFAAGASTTNFSVFGASFFGGSATSSFNSSGQLTLAGISNSLLAANASGLVIASTSIGTNLLTGTLATVNGTAISANGSATITAASSTLLANSNWWTGIQRFTNASTSQLTATSSVYFTSITSALGLFGSGGLLGEYAGSSCTNQFPRSVDAAGAWTCATVGTADVSGLDISDDTNLAATYPVILTGDTLSFPATSTLYANLGTGILFNDAAGAVTASTTLGLDRIPTCVAITGSAGLCDGDDATGGGGGAWPFTPSSYGGVANQSTTTPLWLKDTMVLASTTLFTNSSSTFATLGTTWFSGITHGVLSTNSAGLVVATTTIGTNYISGALGTINSTAFSRGDSITITAASSTLLLDSSWWTGTNRFTNASTSQLTATSTVYLTGLTASSLLAIDNLNRVVATSSIGINLLTASTISGISLGGTLAALTATDSSLTFSGSYTGATARTVGLNVGNANAWTALQTFSSASSTRFSVHDTAYFGGSATTTIASTGAITGASSVTHTLPNASTTALTVGNFLALPQGATTPLALGSLFLDTTSNNITMATSTSGHIVVASATTTLYSFSVASTSARFVSGGFVSMPSNPLAQVVTAVWCKAVGGTSKVIVLSDDGTNDSNSITCTTTGTQFAITANRNFTAYEAIRTEMGATTGVVDEVVINYLGYRTSD